jgi:hypothetical protein
MFVSHNLQAVSMLCNKALYLQRDVQAIGPVDEVVRTYVAKSHSAAGAVTSGGVTIERAELLGAAELGDRAVSPGTEMTLRVTYRAKEAIRDLTFGFVVHRSTDMLVVYDAHCTQSELGLADPVAGRVFAVDYRFRVNLTRGNYFLDCHVLHNPTSTHISRLTPAGTFNVQETRTWTGVADLELAPRLVAAGQEHAVVA